MVVIISKVNKVTNLSHRPRILWLSPLHQTLVVRPSLSHHHHPDPDLRVAFDWQHDRERHIFRTCHCPGCYCCSLNGRPLRSCWCCHRCALSWTQSHRCRRHHCYVQGCHCTRRLRLLLLHHDYKVWSIAKVTDLSVVVAHFRPTRPTNLPNRSVERGRLGIVVVHRFARFVQANWQVVGLEGDHDPIPGTSHPRLKHAATRPSTRQHRARVALLQAAAWLHHLGPGLRVTLCVRSTWNEKKRRQLSNENIVNGEFIGGDMRSREEYLPIFATISNFRSKINFNYGARDAPIRNYLLDTLFNKMAAFWK